MADNKKLNKDDNELYRNEKKALVAATIVAIFMMVASFIV